MVYFHLAQFMLHNEVSQNFMCIIQYVPMTHTITETVVYGCVQLDGLRPAECVSRRILGPDILGVRWPVRKASSQEMSRFVTRQEERTKIQEAHQQHHLLKPGWKCTIEQRFSHG